MKYILYCSLFCLFACNNKSEEKTSVADDTTKIGNATMKDTILTGPLATAFSDKLAADKSNHWTLVTDKTANWVKDQFDYFIAPKRKDNPDYPYITQGDFDGDGMNDIAGLVTDSTNKQFRILVLTGAGKTISWDEDIMSDAALSTIPPGEVDGMDGENTRKVKIKWEAINVEYFEKAAFILYWDGKQFRRLQTGD